MVKFHVMLIPPRTGFQFLSDVYDEEEPVKWVEDQIKKVLMGDDTAVLHLKDKQKQDIFVPRELLKQCLCICLDPAVLEQPPAPAPGGPAPGAPGPGPGIIRPMP